MKVVNVVLVSLMLFALGSCEGSSSPLLNQDQMIFTKLVYNSVASEDEGLEEVDIPREEFSNEFVFEEIRIINSSYFTTVFDYQLEPYFTQPMVGEEIEVVVSILELYSPIYEDWYTQEILILKYGEEMTGFMAPSIRLVDYDSEYYLPYQGQFVFQSSMFMSGNIVTKYYEEDDLIYTYRVDLADTENITVHTSIAYPGDKVADKEEHSFGENYRALEADVTLDLIDQVKVNKVFFEAVITSIDVESGVLFVQSDSLASLTSISLFYDGEVQDADGNLIGFEDLKENDVIRTYYFERYANYQPEDIIVTKIEVK